MDEVHDVCLSRPPQQETRYAPSVDYPYQRARINGMSYSRFIHALKQADIQIDRKMLADLAVNDLGAFGKIVEATAQT